MLGRRNLLRYLYSTVSKGNGFEKRVYLMNKEGKQISFWNDIPLREQSFAKNEFNICIEIPSNRLAKLELTKDEQFHPIKQDTRKNKFNPSEIELRYYAQFPLFNYGFLPQTWESSLEKTPEGFLGDDDPLDVLELGELNRNVGEILKVKVLGAFCLIDQGEVDWKVLTINTKDAELKNIHSLEDVEKQQSGRLNAIKNWFKYIKTFDGKKANHIHYNEKIFDSEKALEIIHETHHFWKGLSTQNPSTHSVQGLQDKQKKYHFHQ